MITVTKDMRGNWRCEDNIDLPGGRQLRISTTKVSTGQLVTRGIVGKADGSVFEYTVFQDFNECINATRPARCTSKAVAEQHGNAMGQIESLKTKIAAYYAAEERTLS